MSDPPSQPSPDPKNTHDNLIEEDGLWDLDDDLPSTPASNILPAAPDAPRPANPVIAPQANTPSTSAKTTLPHAKHVPEAKTDKFKTIGVKKENVEKQPKQKTQSYGKSTLSSVVKVVSPGKPSTTKIFEPAEDKKIPPAKETETTPEPPQAEVTFEKVIEEPEIVTTPDILEELPVVNTPIKPKKKRKPFSPLEKLSFAILMLGMVGLSIMAVSSLVSDMVFDGDDRVAPNYPLKGHTITIESATTHWRRPNFDGPSADPSSVKAGYLPVATLKISSDSSAGSLRLYFANDTGEIIGDPKTLSVTPGQTINYSSTDGFKESGHLAAYTAREIGTWHLVCMEAASTSITSKDFSKIGLIPLSSSLKE